MAISIYLFVCPSVCPTSDGRSQFFLKNNRADWTFLAQLVWVRIFFSFFHLFCDEINIFNIIFLLGLALYRIKTIHHNILNLAEKHIFFVHLCVSVCMHVCVYICMCVCMCLCVHVYVYVCSLEQ